MTTPRMVGLLVFLAWALLVAIKHGFRGVNVHLS